MKAFGHRKSSVATTVLVLLMGHASLRAGNKLPLISAFESQTVSQQVPAGSNGVTFTWTYTNHWDFPTAIERFEESCGCLKGVPDDEVVKPGKTGQVSAVMTPGTYRGKIRKSLHVRFVGHDEAVELVAEALIPSGVELSSNELSWEPGQSTAQTLDVKSGTGVPFAITGLLGVTGLFDIRQETLIPNLHYRLHITPTGAPGIGPHILQVRTDSKDPRDQVFAVFLKTSAPAKTATPPAQTAATP